MVERTAGTPQGGVISPVLANLFMYYAFDEWMKRTYPYCPFERYADDTVIHCKTEAQARFILDKVSERMQQCRLELHPQKTKIVYCKDKDRTGKYGCTEFDFLGYTFRKTLIKDKLGRLQWNFLASVSKKACQSLKDKIKTMEFHKRSGSKIEMIAETINPIVRGWMNYFGAYNRSAMKGVLNVIQRRLIKWAMCKYKRLPSEATGDVRKNGCMRSKRESPSCLRIGLSVDDGIVIDKSRMNREVHVRFCESFGVKAPLATRLRGRSSLSPSYSILYSQ